MFVSDSSDFGSLKPKITGFSRVVACQSFTADVYRLRHKDHAAQLLHQLLNLMYIY
jgi:hypothetical protein